MGFADAGFSGGGQAGGPVVDLTDIDSDVIITNVASRFRGPPGTDGAPTYGFLDPESDAGMSMSGTVLRMSGGSPSRYVGISAVGNMAASHTGRDLGTGSIPWNDLFIEEIICEGDIEIDGALNHDGSTVGFYGVTPIALQTGVAVTEIAIHAALVALNLITA